MKTKLTLLCLIMFSLTGMLRAQVYTQGDVWVNVTHNYVHDSTQCATLDTVFAAITIQNSFVGDSMMIKATNNPSVFHTASNTSGQSPWVINLIVQDYPSAFSDFQVQGGILINSLQGLKLISGPDTVYFPDSWVLQVPDPCEYSTLDGRVFYDYNGNCTYDSAFDVPLQGIFVDAFVIPSLVTANDATQGQHVTDALGLYHVRPRQSWMQTVQVALWDFNPLIFPTTSCFSYQYFINTLPNTVDFAIDCSSNFDLQCYAGSPGSVRPLIPFLLHPAVSNTGCPPVSGILHLVLDNRVAYNAGLSSLPADSISGDTLMWYYNNLTNITNGAYWNSFLAATHLTPNGTINIGDTLCFTIFTDVPAGDVDATNNLQTICLPVVNSFDPNLKEVSPQGEGVQGLIPATTDELTYTVHFQNTGNAVAFNIYVADTLDGNIIPGSVQILQADHTMTPYWVDSTIINFRFNNINLPDSTSNEPESHGMFRYKVKLKPNLAPGTQIKNRAAIYFDTNEPIYTNTTLNTIETPQGFIEARNSVEMKLYPNPGTNVLYVQVDKTLVGAQLNVYDVTGALLQTNKLTTSNAAINTTNFPAGVYIAEVKTGEVAVKQRWVKM